MIKNWGFREAWVISLAVKIVLAVLIPLSLDESYYWVWGQHPQLSYFDHPPMVGWLFYLGRAVEFIGGSSSRIPGVLLSHCTFLVWNLILKPYLNGRQRTLWLLLVIVSPLIGWGSLIQTPDVGFVFFWSLAILALLRALETKKLNWYFVLGASLGLGFCSKYPIVLFVPSLFLYLALEKKWRDVRWNYAAATVIVGLIFCAPVIIWNYQHEWESFLFQLGHGLKSGAKKNHVWPAKYLVEQFLFLFPSVVIFAFKSKLPEKLRPLKYFGWFPIVFFFVTSFKARVEPNWPIAAYPVILTIAFFALQESVWYKRTVAVWFAAFVIVMVEVFHPFIPVEPSKLKTNELRKYDALISHAESLDPVYASSYQLASALSYRLKREIPKLQGMSRRDFYDFLPLSRPNSDRFFVLMEGDEALPEWVVKEGYEIRLTTPVTDQFKVVEVSNRAKAVDP